MIAFLQRRKLSKAVDSYVRRLGPALVKRYSLLDQYTVMQVEKTVRVLGLNCQYMPYAIALYRRDASENTISIFNIDQAFLDILRQEIANACFNGDAGFSVRSVLELSRPAVWRGGRPSAHVVRQAMFYAGSSR